MTTQKSSIGDLTLENLVKTFPQRDNQGEVRAVDDVSLQIYSGEFVTLLGPSGCGKTTTLRLISGFEMPTNGTILLDGKNISHLPPNKRDMAMVFQSYALFPHMSVFDNISYGLATARMSKSDIQKKVQESLAMMGLDNLGKRRPNELSGGQQQRVALARSLVMEPRVLLFDEPLSNLDAKLRTQMRSEIRRIQRTLGITSIYVTHDQIEAMSMSDRIVVMNEGKIDQVGSPVEIYRRPTTRFVADFIGRANFIPTTVDAVAGEQVTVQLLGRTVTVHMDAPPSVGTEVTAVLRPETMYVAAQVDYCAATVEQAMYLGAEVEYVLSVNDVRMVVIASGMQAVSIFDEGQTVGITFDDAAVHLLHN
ncbi:ABC transporter ATP-binding protein [Chloroflexota bacterium]